MNIVERLREYSRNLGGSPEDYLAWQAADEIERLRALSQNSAHAWDALVQERDALREKLKALTGREGGKE